VKKIHTEILSEDNREILTKGLTAMYKIKQASLTNEGLIQVCHNSKINEHLEVKRTENLIQKRCNISNLRNQITKYIIKYNSCHRNKIQRDKRYDEVTQLNTSDVS